MQVPVGVVAAQQQHTRRIQRADDPADDRLGGQPAAEFLPAAHPGPVGLVEEFGDDTLDPRSAVADQPAAGDRRVGGGRGEHQPGGQAASQQRLQRGAAVPVGQVARVGAAVREQVEHDERRRHRGGEGVGVAGTGPQPVLQGSEVEPARVPDHQLAVEHHPLLRGQAGERGGDVGEGAVSRRCWRDCNSTPASLRKVRHRLVD
jgi:hypothetical protein